MDLKSKYTDEERAIARSLRPIDDTLFRTMAKDNIPLVEHIVRVTLNRDDISILKVNTQDDIHLFDKGHSVILDCLAVDKEGTYYDIEVQASKKGDEVKRARYISSMIDSRYALGKGISSYNEIKSQIVLFLMEEDIFDRGKQLYKFKRIEEESKLPLDDGSLIIYVNAKNKGREELDNLMQSLVSSNYLEMKDNVIRGCTMYYKTTVEGEDHVCDAVQQYAEKYAEQYATKSYDNGRTEGINTGTVKTLLNLVNSGNITLGFAIENSGLNKEEFYSIAESLGYKV